MRISTNYMYNEANRSMQTSVANLLHTQEIMATQRKINHLSDDPVGMGRILNVDRMISQNEQFSRNIDTAQTMTSLYDKSFDSTLNLLSRTKELLLAQTNSAASTPQTREAARVEIVSLASELTTVGNSQYGDRFMFAGFANETAPFVDMSVTAIPAGANTGGAAVTYQQVATPSLVNGDAYSITFTSPTTYDIADTTTGTPVSTGNAYASGGLIQFGGVSIALTDSPAPPAAGDVFNVSTAPAGTYVGDSGVIKMETDQDAFEQTNFTGDMVFRGVGLPNGVDLFDIFQRANTALQNNDQTELNTLLKDVDAGSAQITQFQSIAGARENAFQKTQDRLLEVKTNMQVTLSDLQDVDITQAISDLNRQDNAYQAVLAATSKTLQPTLLDFLQ
jgi:flagellar hook-associated protein 3 FlgL